MATTAISCSCQMEKQKFLLSVFSHTVLLTNLSLVLLTVAATQVATNIINKHTFCPPAPLGTAAAGNPPPPWTEHMRIIILQYHMNKNLLWGPKHSSFALHTYLDGVPKHQHKSVGRSLSNSNDHILFCDDTSMLHLEWFTYMQCLLCSTGQVGKQTVKHKVELTSLIK